MSKFLRVGVRRADKIYVLNQGEQEMSEDGIQDGVVYRQLF